MRVTSTINEDGKNGGGVAAGVYPNPMFMKYVTAQGFDNFDDASITDGVLIPSNYIASATQTAVDNAYNQVTALYKHSDGPMDTDESIKVKAPAFANFLKGNLVKIAPYASINTDMGDVGVNGGILDMPKYFKVDTNKFGVMWTIKDGVNNRFYFKIGNRTSGKIVWTAAQIVTGINANVVGLTNWSVEGVDANKMIIVYNDKNNSNFISAVAFTVDASGILALVGTPFQIAASANQIVKCVEYVAVDKIIVCYNTLATTYIISAAALVLSKGTVQDIKGSRNVGCVPHIRYISDNKLLLCIPDSLDDSGILSGRIISVSGTTMTLETENTIGGGGATNFNILGLWVINATRAYVWISYSGSYLVGKITISGTTATMGFSAGLSGIPTTLNQNFRILGNRLEEKMYSIDTSNKIIYRHNSEGELEKQFSITGNLSWPTQGSPNNGEPNYRYKDLRDGISFVIRNFDATNLDIASAKMICSGIRADVNINGIASYTNSGVDQFGIVAALDEDLSANDQIELEVINKSSGFRVMEIDSLIVTVT